MITLKQCEEEHRKLIYSIALPYSKYHDIDDLLQEGFEGLKDAYDNYDESRDVKFSTFAYLHIKGKIKKYVREDKVIRMSRDDSNLSKKIYAVKDILIQELMREPSPEELAIYLKEDVNKVKRIMRTDTSVVSLDKEMDGMSLHEAIADKEVDRDTLIDLKRALSDLSDREQQFINSRYVEEKSQAETGKILNMNQVKTSREEKKILKKIYDRVA